MAATDKLRERWERITPRERKLVTILGVTAVVLILGWVWLTIAGGLDSIDTKNEKKREALRKLDKFRREKAMGGGADENAPKVDIPPQPIELESYLERIAKDVGAEIPGYNTLPEAAKGSFQQVSTKVTIKGLDILQLKDLLFKIETGGGGAVIVEELHVKREFRDDTKLEATLVVSTFYDKNAEAAPAAEEEGAPK
jgi:general secretion pathway protein M